MLDPAGDELIAGLHVQHQHDLVLVVFNCLRCEMKMHSDVDVEAFFNKGCRIFFVSETYAISS